MLASRECFKFKWGVPIFVSLAFLGALLWARSVDPFQRIEFTLKTFDQGRVKGMVVLPKPLRPSPVVVYLHGSGDTLMTDGKQLRQLAELGLAAVGLEYDQTNQMDFDEQFLTLLQFLQRQPWAVTNAVAWVGSSQGAQQMLSFLLKHPELQPQLLVRLSGGWVPELDSPFSLPLRRPVLLVHGASDDIFPVQDVTRLAGVLRAQGIPVAEKVLDGQSHAFGINRPLVIRLVAEYCRSVLAPNQPFKGVPERHIFPFWLWMLPALAWAGLSFHRWRKTREETQPKYHRQLNGWEKRLGWMAVVLAAWVAAETVVHFITPRLATSDRTLAIARRYLIAPKWTEDFDCLSTNAVWRGKPLELLLDHIELAHYNRNELINWKVDEQIYRQFVLSPNIDSAADQELNWRRPLWESFYPRIRKEDSPESAAQIVGRHLRERVTIDPKLGYTPGIVTAWAHQITDEKGFEIIYVAALRSVGIGARLNQSGRAEYWSGKKWENAPRPVSAILL